jgi:hypothetical protein
MRIFAAILTLTLLVGCSSVRNVNFIVRDAQTAQPAEGVRVRTVSLNTGAAPLPLDSDTIDEILASGSIVEAATTGPKGMVHLRMRSSVPYIVELIPPPLGPGSQAVGEPVRVDRFMLSKHAASLFPVSGNQLPEVYTLEIVR